MNQKSLSICALEWRKGRCEKREMCVKTNKIVCVRERKIERERERERDTDRVTERRRERERG
jgi:hypothetical protein